MTNPGRRLDGMSEASHTDDVDEGKYHRCRNSNNQRLAFITCCVRLGNRQTTSVEEVLGVPFARSGRGDTQMPDLRLTSIKKSSLPPWRQATESRKTTDLAKLPGGRRISPVCTIWGEESSWLKAVEQSIENILKRLRSTLAYLNVIKPTHRHTCALRQPRLDHAQRLSGGCLSWYVHHYQYWPSQGSPSAPDNPTDDHEQSSGRRYRH